MYGLLNDGGGGVVVSLVQILMKRLKQKIINENGGLIKLTCFICRTDLDSRQQSPRREASVFSRLAGICDIEGIARYLI